MAAAAPIGFALQGLSLIVGAVGENAAGNYQAQQAEQAAKIGRIQADQTTASMVDELNTTVSNIRAVRAATGANPDSPSSTAYIEGQAKRSDRERRIRVGGLRMQANQYENDARFYRGAAKVALVGGVLGGLGASAKAFAPTGTA